MKIKGAIKTALYKCLPEDAYLKTVYRHYHGRKLNLKNPVFLTEKLFWLKKNNPKIYGDLIQRIYDKYTVRDYLKEKIGEKYLTKLYGVYDSPSEINFKALPEKYVLKVTQSCGYNIINDGTKLVNESEIRNKLQEWISIVNSPDSAKSISREENYYFNGKAKIICEEYLEDKDGKGAMDVDFWCINGTPVFYEVFFDFFVDGEKNQECFKNAYDINGNLLNVQTGRHNNKELKQPHYDNFEEMVSVAQTLSKDFAFMRVDLYNVDGRIVVGELTPIPMGGAGKITPESFDKKMGDLLILPEIK